MPTVATRRGVLFGGGVAALAARGRAGAPMRLGLTPVFLDNDAEVIGALREALSDGVGGAIELVQRRTYQEVTGLLLQGGVDAAWLCGYPFLQHEAALTLLGAPVWRGRPLYRSYLIAAADDAAQALADLAGGAHAFSDPDSNSGWLVTASDLARLGKRPETFFDRTLFAWGHRNVVRAVASGLTRSGSVDGYVWEALAASEPALIARTRVVSRSELLGFPPFVARRDRGSEADVAAFRAALMGLHDSAAGREALVLLHLDRVAPGRRADFNGIASRMADVAGLR
ncbi:PhnD/SsuA/transferrin family substrate-binding protein [Rubrimonas cliftonensis]|uniref:Phosphonate transport system substrate-binding protein n=1 Tax=Rubrimonas cliftonensis TaxID=89524 RepID=A0A1H4F1F5_9RHOB|nr:PhnD/SsuA/transferrin family substrate-binding protein [Rubrimonas cliftonensis]SEA90817.1 phosphonate transport system substrate-binding protein [Rubrimonas cliftonensis]